MGNGIPCPNNYSHPKARYARCACLFLFSWRHRCLFPSPPPICCQFLRSNDQAKCCSWMFLCFERHGLHTMIRNFLAAVISLSGTLCDGNKWQNIYEQRHLPVWLAPGVVHKVSCVVERYKTHILFPSQILILTPLNWRFTVSVPEHVPGAPQRHDEIITTRYLVVLGLQSHWGAHLFDERRKKETLWAVSPIWIKLREKSDANFLDFYIKPTMALVLTSRKSWPHP